MIGPQQRQGLAVRHGRRWSGRALAGVGLLGTLVWAATGCRPATTEPNTPKGQGNGAPLVVISPAQDTTVDSTGTLPIVIAVHDAAYIDTVAVTFQGASQAYLPFYSGDTLFQAIIPVSLGPLKHQTFSYAVNASNILGRDTTTSSVNVRVR